jgi:hypothetical protein
MALFLHFQAGREYVLPSFLRWKLSGWSAPMQCPSPEPKQWWQKGPLYKLDVKKFRDSDQDSVGDLKGAPFLDFYLSNQGCGSGSAWIRINLSCWIRIRIQIADPVPDPGGQKLPTKIEKSTEFSCFEVLDVLF